MVDVTALFKRHFGFPPAHVLHVPGWVPLLGEETESEQGLVLTAALEPGLTIALAPRLDGKVELFNSTSAEAVSFWVNDFRLSKPWADPIKVTLQALERRGVHFRGFSAALVDETPAGAAATPSLGLAMGTLLTVYRLYPFRLKAVGVGSPPEADRRNQVPPLPSVEKWLWAKLCQTALAMLADSPPSLLGPLSLLFGQAWNLVALDLRFENAEVLPCPGEAFVLCRLPEAQPLASLSREWPGLCRQTATQLGAHSLRSVEPTWLEEHKGGLSPLQFACVRRVATELQRVVAAERALRVDDHVQLGHYLTQSQQESLNPVSAQASLALTAAQSHPACLGARLWRDSLAALIQFHQAELFTRHLTSQALGYPRTGLTPVVCRTAGARFTL